MTLFPAFKAHIYALAETVKLIFLCTSPENATEISTCCPELIQIQAAFRRHAPLGARGPPSCAIHCFKN